MEKENFKNLDLNQVGGVVKPDPRDFSHPKDFLVSYWFWKRKQKPGYSLRMWATKMNFNNHTLLSFLLSGRRVISPKHLIFLKRGFELNAVQIRCFELLVHLTAANSEAERSLYEEQLKPLIKNGKRMVFRDVESFRLVSNWIHTAILEMTQLKDFQSDPKWIAAHLENDIPVSEIKDALKRLKELGLIEEKNLTLKKRDANLTFGGEKANAAVREYHRQVTQLAYRAIEKQNHQDRILNSFTLTINSKKLPDAEKLIFEFRKNLEALLEASPGDSTYQCNVQLFRLTKKGRDQ